MTATSAMAAPVVIYSNYIGQDTNSASNSNLKVIGDPDVFGLDHFVVDLAAGTVSVYGNYISNIGELGTTLGDLLLSTSGYHPFLDTSSCEAPALATCADNYVTGNQWNLAAVLDNHAPGVGTGGLFNLFAIMPANYVLSSIVDPDFDFRHGQAVGASGGVHLGIGSYWVYSDHLTFNFGVGTFAALGFGEGDGLRFTESCANDVLEGEIPGVPEPGSMLLLGTGLVGLAGAIRRRMNAR